MKSSPEIKNTAFPVGAPTSSPVRSGSTDVPVGLAANLPMDGKSKIHVANGWQTLIFQISDLKFQIPALT